MATVGRTGQSAAARFQLRVAESVAAELRNRILSGQVPDGTLQKQELLMEEFNVSAPSIREALRILDAEGLITVRRGKFGGAEVHRPDSSTAAFAIGLSLQGQRVQLHDLADALLQLEPLCAAACARREDRMSTVVPALERNLAQTEVLLDHPDDLTQAARGFHQIIVTHAESQTMRLVTQSLVAIWTIQEATWASSVARHGRYPDMRERRAVLRAHTSMLKHIAAGDANAAAEATRKHTHATQHLVISTFGNEVVDASSPLAFQEFRRL